jgi:hypothetical protein
MVITGIRSVLSSSIGLNSKMVNFDIGYFEIVPTAFPKSPWCSTYRYSTPFASIS